MKRIAIIFLFTLCIGFVFASSYSLELNQIEDKLVVREYEDGISSKTYVDEESLEKTKEGYLLLKKLEFLKDYQNFSIILNLDSGNIIREKEAYPVDYITTTDGKKISLSWEGNMVKEGESIVILVDIKEPSKSNFLLWVLLILIILSLAFIYLRRSKVVRRSDVQKYLLDEERKMTDGLRKADRNEMWQKNIQSQLNLSKAKTSRLVRNLETRNLIEKIPFGNTNKIRLR